MENLTKGYEGSNLNLNEEVRPQAFANPIDSEGIPATKVIASTSINYNFWK
jgi:hypothetical protein